MDWYRHHWWWVGVVVAVGVLVYLLVAWGELDVEQRVMIGIWTGIACRAGARLPMQA